MLVKLGSIFPIVNTIGKEMDQGSMMRYLDEMLWFPSAFLRKNLAFEPVDDRSTKITLTDLGRSVTATIFFDNESSVQWPVK